MDWFLMWWSYQKPALPSQSKGVKKYKFKIKKENERCLEYLIEDQKYLNEDHDPEEENVKFTIPLAFQVGGFATMWMGDGVVDTGDRH